MVYQLEILFTDLRHWPLVSLSMFVMLLLHLLSFIVFPGHLGFDFVDPFAFGYNCVVSSVVLLEVNQIMQAFPVHPGSCVILYFLDAFSNVGFIFRALVVGVYMLQLVQELLPNLRSIHTKTHEFVHLLFWAIWLIEVIHFLLDMRRWRWIKERQQLLRSP